MFCSAEYFELFRVFGGAEVSISTFESHPACRRKGAKAVRELDVVGHDEIRGSFSIFEIEEIEPKLNYAIWTYDDKMEFHTTQSLLRAVAEGFIPPKYRAMYKKRTK